MMTDQLVFSLLLGLVWFWLVLHRMPHRNRIRREKWEVASVALQLFVPVLCRRLKRAVSWPALPWGSRVLASAQCLQPLVAILWDALLRELVVHAGMELRGRSPCCKPRAAEEPPCELLGSSTSPEVLGMEAVPCCCLRACG